MILSDQGIIEEIKAGKIVFDPPISDTDFSPSSVDVHLGSFVYTFRSPLPAIDEIVDLDHPDVHKALDGLLEPVSIPEEGYCLRPQGFVLARTKETVTLPDHLAARLEGRSTLARFGICIHSTAPTVHPTWTGPLTLEISNRGLMSCTLKKGMSIGQLIFEKVAEPLPRRTVTSVWQGQKPPSATNHGNPEG